MNDLQGKQIITGANALRIEFYQRANRFMGGFMGLDRKELINNTHYRVLFVKGLYKHVSTYFHFCRKLECFILDYQILYRNSIILINYQLLSL